MAVDPFGYCPCGHMWVMHDVYEHIGDGTELCCEDGCTQIGCPGWEEKKNVPA